ncbi:UNKNOWN [Stylonychia lemnae]|uniref:Uncharacterized protein n=1 Tax=Stylonychia lemnae TaxID=5949 RepID=A0A078AM68_STYLE|nr:UNKNOWN [Stylonychia lemnae]|eukprot:CDW83314.1 UNKNOWN [Stylonychia lemnae]
MSDILVIKANAAKFAEEVQNLNIMQHHQLLARYDHFSQRRKIHRRQRIADQIRDLAVTKTLVNQEKDLFEGADSCRVEEIIIEQLEKKSQKQQHVNEKSAVHRLKQQMNKRKMQDARSSLGKSDVESKISEFVPIESTPILDQQQLLHPNQQQTPQQFFEKRLRNMSQITFRSPQFMTPISDEKLQIVKLQSQVNSRAAPILEILRNKHQNLSNSSQTQTALPSPTFRHKASSFGIQTRGSQHRMVLDLRDTSLYKNIDQIKGRFYIEDMIEQQGKQKIKSYIALYPSKIMSEKDKNEIGSEDILEKMQHQRISSCSSARIKPINFQSSSFHNNRVQSQPQDNGFLCNNF